MALISDTFNRANSTSLGANWTEDNGSWAIASNRLEQETAGALYRKCRWVGSALSSNNYAVQGVHFTGNNAAVGSGVFGRGIATTAVTYYCLVIFPNNNGIHIVELAAGTGAILASAGPTLALNTTYTLRLECEGSNLRGYLDDVLQVSTTDATLASGSVGVMAFEDQDAAGSLAYCDSWSAWDLAYGIPLAPRRNYIKTNRRVI
jgi:pectate lyase